jgi:hypothetical protein
MDHTKNIRNIDYHNALAVYFKGGNSTYGINITEKEGSVLSEDG